MLCALRGRIYFFLGRIANVNEFCEAYKCETNFKAYYKVKPKINFSRQIGNMKLFFIGHDYMNNATDVLSEEGTANPS